MEKLKGQLTIREQADDLANRFKRISLAQSRNTGQNVELDSDDDEYCDDEDNCDSMVGNEKGALVAATQVDVSEESPVNKEKTPKRSGKWAYDSAVTQVKAHVFEVMINLWWTKVQGGGGGSPRGRSRKFHKGGGINKKSSVL